MVHDTFGFTPADSDHVHIYCLFDSKEQCIYVGQTIQLKRRIYEHLASGKEFVRVDEKKVPKENGNAAEAETIVLMQPPLNKSLPKSSRYMTTAQLKNTIAALVDTTGKLTPILFQSGSCKYVDAVEARQIVANVSNTLALIEEGSI
jgi:hypothetical protein